jgi:hypothetical protein
VLRRGSKKAAPAAPKAATVVKHKFSIYTVMLLTSLGALVIGCILLYMEISRFGGFGAVGGAS